MGGQRAGQAVARRSDAAQLARGLELLARRDESHDIVQAREHFGGVGRLGDEIVRAGLARALLVGLLLDPGNDHHRHLTDARERYRKIFEDAKKMRKAMAIRDELGAAALRQVQDLGLARPAARM